MLKKLAVLFVAFWVLSTNSHAENVYAYRSYVNSNVPGINNLEHTFSYVSTTGEYYTFPSGTNKSSGVFFTGGYASRAKGFCHASCSMTYLDNGTCHQHTNRVLYLSGAALNTNISGYYTSRLIYGATGNKRGPTQGRFQACWDACGGLSTLATD